MPHRSAPTRTLPAKPSLTQLRKQAKELLQSYRAGDEAAVAEVERFERHPNRTEFALADAQRVLARAYGFSSWTRLKQQVEGVTAAAFIAAADAGDIATVRKLARMRPDLVDPYVSDFHGNALHRAVCNRNAEMTRVLMQLGADARTGIWPHRDATSAYTIARDRQYDEIVAIIEHEEERRRQALSSSGVTIDSRIDGILKAIRSGQGEEAIQILEADLSLVGCCDVHGATPLHKAAAAHSPEMVTWLFAHAAIVDSRDAKGRTPLDYAALTAGWSANDQYFPYLGNALVDPARFYETVRLLRESGAELTARAAVAIGDREAVMKMHGAGELKNEIEFYGGGLLTIAVRVNRIEMVRLLLDLGFHPDEAAARAEDGGESWGFPLWFAAVCGRHDIAEMLLMHGADANAIVHASGDPLGNAQETGDTKMQALLLKHGAHPLTVEQALDPETAKAILDGTLPAHSLNVRNPSHTDLAEQMLWAASRSNPEIVRMCLPHMTRTGDDPWWNYVFIHALPECFKLVLEHGIDPDVVAERGYTMLHHVAHEYVKDEHRIPFATMLLDAGASLDKRDSLLKSTPLGWACRWGRRELAEFYLERGADPVEPIAEPWATPLAWAKKSGREEIVALLQSRGAK